VDPEGGEGPPGAREAPRRALRGAVGAGVRDRDPRESMGMGQAGGDDVVPDDVLSRPDLLPGPLGSLRDPRAGPGGPGEIPFFVVPGTGPCFRPQRRTPGFRAERQSRGSVEEIPAASAALGMTK
jgi:hypothetical protein